MEFTHHRIPRFLLITINNLGSNVIVAGTAIFGAENPGEVIAVLKSTVDAAQARIAANK